MQLQRAAAWHSQSVDDLTEHVLAFDLFLSMLQRSCVNSGSVGFCLQSWLQALIGFVLFFFMQLQRDCTQRTHVISRGGAQEMPDDIVTLF